VHHSPQCCAVLCCAVLCCAVLCCAVLCLCPRHLSGRVPNSVRPTHPESLPPMWLSLRTGTPFGGGRCVAQQTQSSRAQSAHDQQTFCPGPTGTFKRIASLQPLERHTWHVALAATQHSREPPGCRIQCSSASQHSDDDQACALPWLDRSVSRESAYSSSRWPFACSAANAETMQLPALVQPALLAVMGPVSVAASGPLHLIRCVLQENPGLS